MFTSNIRENWHSIPKEEQGRIIMEGFYRDNLNDWEEDHEVKLKKNRSRKLDNIA